jgi:hypothetical protein
MSDLTGKKIKDTYGNLLRIDGTTDSSGITSTLRSVIDGTGDASALQISSTSISSPVIHATTSITTPTATITTGNITNVITDNLTAGTVDINGGTIDGTKIGGQQRATGEFVSLDVAGAYTNTAHTNIHRDKTKTTISKEDVIFEKAGVLAAAISSTKNYWGDFLVIETNDSVAGGNFVVEVEGIITSGIDAGLPGYNGGRYCLGCFCRNFKILPS